MTIVREKSLSIFLKLQATHSIYPFDSYIKKKKIEYINPFDKTQVSDKIIDV